MPRAKDEEDPSKMVSPGITIPKGLLDEFDNWLKGKKGKYASRSEAVRDAMKLLMQNGNNKHSTPDSSARKVAAAAQVPPQ